MKLLKTLKQIAFLSQIGLFVNLVFIAIWPTYEFAQGWLYIWAVVSVIVFTIGNLKYGRTLS